MKKRLAAIIGMTILSIMSNQIAKAQKYYGIDLPIKLENIPYNFGTFPKDSIVTATLTFSNATDKELQILEADTSCGCVTINDYTKKPIKPGKKGKINVSIDCSGKKPGKFEQFVVIGINQEPKYIRLFMTGNTTK